MSQLATKIPALIKGALEASGPKLNTFVHYAKVELVPPSPGEIGTAVQGLGNIVKSAQTGAWRKLTVKEAWVNTLVAGEIACWFFVGECIGKGTLVGYQV
ncbi:ATP synthase F(0) complex subunit g, mitochondrial-like [Oratosquilla oratoria]|uniref:ATP synthase F(0) complex subunit g, mitochondrial-like n=1 Tax=Oratosquilla oratoria TaxID=337810 RepID=UPI003F76F0B4